MGNSAWQAKAGTLACRLLTMKTGCWDVECLFLVGRSRRWSNTKQALTVNPCYIRMLPMYIVICLGVFRRNSLPAMKVGVAISGMHPCLMYFCDLQFTLEWQSRLSEATKLWSTPFEMGACFFLEERSSNILDIMVDGNMACEFDTVLRATGSDVTVCWGSWTWRQKAESTFQLSSSHLV